MNAPETKPCPQCDRRGWVFSPHPWKMGERATRPCRLCGGMGSVPSAWSEVTPEYPAFTVAARRRRFHRHLGLALLFLAGAGFAPAVDWILFRSGLLFATKPAAANLALGAIAFVSGFLCWVAARKSRNP